MRKKWDQLWSRVPTLLGYILSQFVLYLIIIGIFMVLAYAILSITGIYGELESALNLKANSPWVLVPLYATLSGAVLCFLIGSLMYFHKYKRAKSGTKFRAAFQNVLQREQPPKESRR